MSLCPHGYTAFYDCPTCPEPLGAAAIPTTVMCDWCDGSGTIRTVRGIPSQHHENGPDYVVDIKPCSDCRGTGEVVVP